MFFFFRSGLSESFQHFVKSNVKILETFSELVIRCETRNEIGIFYRLEEPGEFTVGLAYEAKDLDELKDQDHKSEDCGKKHIGPCDHELKQGHSDAQKNDSYGNACMEILKTESYFQMSSVRFVSHEDITKKSFYRMNMLRSSTSQSIFFQAPVQ
jgi:hypothetical protein